MKPAKTKSAPKPRVLDEETSAAVIAEYLAIETVETKELDFIEQQPGRGLTNREIALAFRVSEALEIPCCFEMAPRFRTAFARARVMMSVLKDAGTPAAVGDGER